MKVLVTGATGFIGNHVIRELLKTGHEVIATSTSKKNAEGKDWYSNVKYIEFSLGENLDQKNLYNFFDSPDLLIHLAWSGLPNYKDFSHIDRNLFVQLNFIQNLISNGLKDIAATGTCFEYGMQSGELREDMVTLPDNPYAIAKDSLRKFLEFYQKKIEFDLKWIRLFYMHGEGQSPKSLISLLDQAVAKNEKTFKMSGGEQLRDYLKVTEVAQTIVRISVQKKVTGVINCCSGDPISVRKLVEHYLLENNINIDLELGYYPYPDYEPMAFWGSNKKLKTITGTKHL